MRGLRLFLLVLLCAGCGDDSIDGDGAGAGAGPGASPTPDGGTPGTAGDGTDDFTPDSGASTPGDGDGDGDGTPASMIDECADDAGPTTVFELPEGTALSSPEMTADGLLLFYTQSAENEPPGSAIFATSRSSRLDPFPPGTMLAGAEQVCAAGQGLSLDISPDGLRLYYTCYVPGAARDQRLRLMMMERADVDSDFGAAVDVGDTVWLFGIAPDERTVASSDGEAVYFGTRASTDVPFAASTVSTLTVDYPFSPAMSEDNLELYGNGPNMLWKATRASADQEFGAGEPFVTFGPDTIGGAVEPNGGCLYYTELNMLPPRTYRLRRIRR